jgi:murein L,D-transpeptidase YafK
LADRQLQRAHGSLRLGAIVAATVLLHAAPTVAYARQGAAQKDLPDSLGAPLAVARAPLDFSAAQLRNARVLRARLETRFGIKRLFRERGLTYPAEEIFVRVFKRERILELWVRPAGAPTFALLKQYMVCALRGELGPKRAQGDGQTPEGFYEIDQFNPNSQYHLSLHVDYPNRSDRTLGGSANLGGDIFIHGGCETEGCIAVTNDAIKELYWIGVEARAAGQERIPVHIFPARMTAEELTLLERRFADRPGLVAFWTSLKPGYDYFERNRLLPPIRVDEAGRYMLLGEAADGAKLSTARSR